MNPAVRLLLQILLPLLVISGGYLVARDIVNNPPGAKKAPPAVAQPTPVDVETLQSRDYQIVLRSYGSVEPRTQTTLIPQVSGVITNVADAFRSGGYFSNGDVLLQIDDSDYRIAVRDAEAPLLKARAALAEEQARAQQAVDDWKSLERKTKPSALVLRTPQVDAAKAEVLAAEARLERAKLDLQRTRIVAPYDGRVQETTSDIGQYVRAGTELATIFATDVLEVRLPLNRDQLEQIELPEQRRGANAIASFPHAVFVVDNGSTRWEYTGRIVRTESAIDTGTRQLFVVGEIDTPFDGGDSGGGDNDKPLLKIGQFVDAGVHGKTLRGVFVIPRRLLLQNDEILLAVDGVIERRSVSVVWRDERDAVIDNGLKEGELLIANVLGNAVSGMRIDYPGVAH